MTILLQDRLFFLRTKNANAARGLTHNGSQKLADIPKTYTIFPIASASHQMWNVSKERVSKHPNLLAPRN